jgi:adenylate cyclase
MEIERKFTINYLPDNIKSVTKITQKHIFKDMVCSIRVRRSINMYTGEKIFTHTIKARTENLEKYSICELEKNITEEEYIKSRPFRGSRTIQKYRCVVPIQDGLKVEIDVFEGWLKGLIIAEVEFKSSKQAEEFKMPNWFGGPLENRAFSNRALSTKSRHEVVGMIGREQFNVNKRILNYLQKRVLKNRI